MCSRSVNVDVSTTTAASSEFVFVEDNADTGGVESKPSTTTILSSDATLNANVVVVVLFERIRFGVIKENVRVITVRIINTHRPRCSDTIIIIAVKG